MKTMYRLMIVAAFFEVFFGVLGGIRVVKAPFEIGEIWHNYSTDPKEYDWDKQVESTGKIVKGFLQAVGYCLIALGWHIFLSKASAKYILQSEQSQDCEVGSVLAALIDKKDKIMMFLFTIAAAFFGGFYGGSGVIGVVKASYEIGEIWFEYNTDPKEHDWDKQVERTEKIVKGLFPAVVYCLIAVGCFIFLSKASKKYILQSELCQDHEVGNVSATLIDKKDTAPVNITVTVTVPDVTATGKPLTVTVPAVTTTGQPVTVTVQPVIQCTEGPPCYSI